MTTRAAISQRFGRKIESQDKKSDTFHQGIQVQERYQPQHANILTRQGWIVLPLCIVVYVVLQGLTSINGVCTAPEYSTYVTYYYFGAGFAFIVMTILMGKKIFEYHYYRGENGEFRGMMYMAAATISIIAGTASFLTSNANYGGVCVDVLGVSSPAAQWSEWLVCVPLMTYMIVTIDDKSDLSFSDYMIILLMGFSVLVGFIMNFHMSYGSGIFLYVFGCLCLLGVLVFVVKAPHAIAPNSGFAAGAQTKNKRHHDLGITTRRNALILLIAVLFPLFPIIYLLGWLLVLDRDQVAVGYIMVSVMSKLFFVNGLIDSQVYLSDSLEADRKKEKLAQDSRRDFLRYVFHELRIPLNTLTIGIGLLQEDKESMSKNPCREALHMMNGATSFMSDTLNDVLFMHKIEEGAMDITKRGNHPRLTLLLFTPNKPWLFSFFTPTFLQYFLPSHPYFLSSRLPSFIVFFLHALITAFVFEDIFRDSLKAVNTTLQNKHVTILFETTVERAENSVPSG